MSSFIQKHIELICELGFPLYQNQKEKSFENFAYFLIILKFRNNFFQEKPFPGFWIIEKERKYDTLSAQGVISKKTEELVL